MGIEHDGVGLHVEVEGPEDATPVVFLHGLTSSGRTWEWLPGAVGTGRLIARVDLRGHGRSEHASGRYTFGHLSDDIVTVLRTNARRPAVLVGHSLGAVVAWRIAQRAPELVAAAFLEDPPLFAPTAGELEGSPVRTIFPMMRSNVIEWQRAGLSADQMAQRVGAIPLGLDPSVTLRDLVTDDALDAMGYSHERMDPGVLDAAIDGSILAGVDTAAPVTRPVFVLAADDAAGAVFASRHADRLAQSHPQIEVVRAAGSGHAIHDERRYREIFCEHLSRFLDIHAPAQVRPLEMSVRERVRVTPRGA
jgi:pimeloyl-ACP methyl ester carboxylesterase